jgi:diketogulonate reductase-like aldo/keto reductase
VLADLAARYGVGVAQLCIRYCLQLGLLPLPKSTSADHMRSDAAIDFEIGKDDMATLTGLSNDIDYGEASAFPVFGKPRQAAGSTKPA